MLAADEWQFTILMSAICAVIGSFILGILLSVRREQQRMARKERRLCAVCGYDLRATPGRCPECGAVATPGLPLTPPLDIAALNREETGSAIKPRSPLPEEHPVLLYDTPNSMEATLLAANLLTKGIDTRVQVARPVARVSGIVQTYPYYKVVVWSGDVEQAVAIVHRFRPAAIEQAEVT
jgi:hypothetical protein